MIIARINVGENSDGAFTSYEKRDIKKIRKDIPEFSNHTDNEISAYYRWWSDDVMCAGWFIYDKRISYEFRLWCATRKDVTKALDYA